MSSVPPGDATAITRAAQSAVASLLPLEDKADFERAARGRIDNRDLPVIPHEDHDRPVWDMTQYRFLDGEVPATVNPSLWRQARLNMNQGLFKVADDVYQVRGYDIANITFVRGTTGWIVIDPLSATETARAAKTLVDDHLGIRPVRAVIYTHSHGDHFAGVLGVASRADVAEGHIPVIAPDGFLEAAVVENVIAGNAMIRRSGYMYGTELPRGPRGQVDAGIGKGDPEGSVALVAPTDLIRHTGEQRTLDGVTITFQMTPGTEAPAEMNFFIPEMRALCMAENCTSVMHNLYTLRGAEIRDGLAWSKYIDESIELFAAESDVVFSTHNWPRFGADDVRDYLEKQRDLYRFIHDQTIRMANRGMTMDEIAEQLRLPPNLDREFANRGYYGTLQHNAKAVYQRYLGWFDGNPANLDRLPPEKAAQRYVEAMGGAAAVLRRASAEYEAGEYRWVAEVVGHVVFSEPDNTAARQLQADAFEQLGYQAESATWRNVYLMGAMELRDGIQMIEGARSAYPIDVVAAMTVPNIFDSFGVRLDGLRAAISKLSMAWRFRDSGEEWTLRVENGALHYRTGIDESSFVTVDLTRSALDRIAAGVSTIDEETAGSEFSVSGDLIVLRRFGSLLESVDRYFPIVTP
jgi:alkyl sulfatase BDS1-like metallo-beta-lactamase superfamily hydrolase